MLYEVVRTVDGHMMVETFTADNVIPAMSVRGFEISGTNQNPRHRTELQGQPVFDGVMGPMWGGNRQHPDGVIRYECPETYDTLSK